MNEGLKMTFREKLADWISGGALTFIFYRVEASEFMCREWRAYALDLGDRLDRIAAEEKPTSNSTVKRMARIARGQE